MMQKLLILNHINKKFNYVTVKFLSILKFELKNKY